MAHRVAKGNGLHLATHRSPLHLRSSIVRARPYHVSQVRYLWWWGRHRNEWSSFDENMEERVRRQQRIIRHQYSKMLRRRALWERDSISRLSWPWKLSARWLYGHPSNSQGLSSTHSSRPKQEESREKGSWRNNPLTTFHKDFDSFKQAVDRAIERDPYGTLFGRRLQSPPSANNSSWTSFSWIFDPKEIKEERVGSEKKVPQPPTSSGPDYAAAPDPIPDAENQYLKASRIPNTQSVAADEYEYDPISMRKVPKAKSDFPNLAPKASKPSTNSNRPTRDGSTPEADGEGLEPPRKTFFEALFGEHGAEIPVKTYKPHKVYGYGLEEKKNKATDPGSNKKSVEFETSRKREFIALKAAKLGNTIDTTAEYWGKYSAEEESVPPEPTKKPREQSEPSDDSPLFSGTTYEGRSTRTPQPRNARSEWLRKEGFGVEQKIPKESGDAVDIPVKIFRPETESSPDRLRRQATGPDSASSTRLEFALDRQIRSTVPTASPLERAASLKDAASEKSEDIDLLRASDVRAAARSARVSKQEKAERKMEARRKLEQDFSAQQTREETGQPFASDLGKSRIAKSLDNVQKHVQDYPDGIVARTVKSMGIFNENWRKYVRPEPKIDLNEPLEFKDESLSNVASIHKPRRKPSTSISFMPSKEVVEAELLSRQRTRALQDANVLAKEKAAQENVKANDLAKNLREEYEKVYGSINVQHRQVKPGEQAQIERFAPQASEPKQHPLSTATVKSSVVRYPMIESYVSKFEPELSQLVQEAKLVRRELHEAQVHYRQLKELMSQEPWTAIETAGANLVKPESNVAISEESLPQGPDSSISPRPAQHVDLDSEEKATPTMQEAIFTPDGSPIWNDEHPPPVAELKEAFTSPFVILKYNHETDSVSRLTAHFYDKAEQGSPSPLKILSGLRHVEKFYPYFSALEQARYEIVGSNFDTLIFRKIRGPRAATKEEEEGQAVAEKATAQHVAEQAIHEAQPSRDEASKEAATVLDEIPTDVEPVPGPAAPTAPPYTPTSKPAPTTAPTPTPQPRIKRQESVFSGTRTSRPGPQITNPIDPEMAAPRVQPPFEPEGADALPRASLLKRLFRTIKRAVLTTLTVGVGVYVVGVITEGLHAKTQQNAIASEVGPRKKVVLPAQSEWTGKRAGIFSTENSR